MKLQTRQCLALKGALEYLLGGRARTIRRNNEDVVGPPEPFKIDADTLMTIAENANRLKPIEEAFVTSSRAKAAAATEAAGGRVEPGSVADFRLLDEIEALRSADQEIRLRKIALPKLKIDDNPGIAAVLHSLQPILKEVPQAQEGDED
jgi:hypothetical protein